MTTILGNEKKLEKLEALIENVYSKCGIEKEILLKQIKSIVRDSCLDLNCENEILEKPIIIHAAIWNCQEVIEILLDNNIDVSKTFNFFSQYGDVLNTNYCKNEEVTSLDILNQKRIELETILNDNDILLEAKEYFVQDLYSVKNCINIIIDRISK